MPKLITDPNDPNKHYCKLRFNAQMLDARERLDSLVSLITDVKFALSYAGGHFHVWYCGAHKALPDTFEEVTEYLQPPK